MPCHKFMECFNVSIASATRYRCNIHVVCIINICSQPAMPSNGNNVNRWTDLVAGHACGWHFNRMRLRNISANRQWYIQLNIYPVIWYADFFVAIFKSIKDIHRPWPDDVRDGSQNPICIDWYLSVNLLAKTNIRWNIQIGCVQRHACKGRNVVVVGVVAIAYMNSICLCSRRSTIQIDSNARNVGDATKRLRAFADFPFSPTKNHLESAVLKCIYISTIMQMCWRACNHFAVPLIYTIVSTCSRHRIRESFDIIAPKRRCLSRTVVFFCAFRFHFAHSWVSLSANGTVASPLPKQIHCCHCKRDRTAHRCEIPKAIIYAP